MKKRIFVLLAAFIIMLALPAAVSAEVIDSGQCGDNLTWQLDDGTLKISGTGEMWDFWSLQFGGNGTPWGDVGDNIKKVVIEEGVTSIGNDAFSNFGQNRCFFEIEELQISKTVKKIGSRAFWAGFKSDVNITINIPDSVEYIDSGAFGYNENIKLSFTENSNLKYIYNILETEYDNLPDGATYIGKCLYAYKGKIEKSFKIKEGTVSITRGAFKGCTNLDELENIEVPDSLTIVDRSEFEITKWYENQDSGLVYLGKIAYTYKGDQSSEIILNIQDGTIGIANGAFYDYSRDAYNITSLILPDSIEYIGDSAFRDTPIVNISLPSNLKYIGVGAFYRTQIRDVLIPNNIEYIGSQAFINKDNNINLQVDTSNNNYCTEDGILFNKNKTVIYDSSGLSCDTYELPTTVKIIHSLSGAKNFIINEGVEHIDNWVIDEGVESIVLPKSLKTIGGYNLQNVSQNIYYRGSEDDWKAIYKCEFGNWTQCNIIYNAIGMNPPQIDENPTVTVSGNKYTVNVKLQNVEYDSNIIAVAYNKGTVTGFNIENILVGDTQKEISINADSANSIKVFIWDSLMGMRPLCTAIEQYVQ